MKSVTLLSLQQLIDLCTGGSTPGTIDFDLLRYTMHILVHQLGLSDVQVQLEGEKSERAQCLIDSTLNDDMYVKPKIMLINPNNDATSVKIKGPTKTEREYFQSERALKDSDKANEKIELERPKSLNENRLSNVSKIAIPRSRSMQNITRTDKRSLTKEKKLIKPPVSSKKPALKENRPSVKQDASQILIVEDNVEGQPLKVSAAVTTKEIQNLFHLVETMRHEIDELKGLSNNETYINAIRRSSKGSTTSGPMQDMYQILGLSKRMEAAERGIVKLASVVEDIARDSDNMSATLLQGNQRSIGETAHSNDISYDEPSFELHLAQLNRKEVVNVLIRELIKLRRVIFGSSSTDLEEGEVSMPARLARLEVRVPQHDDLISSLDALVGEHVERTMLRIGRLERDAAAMSENIAEMAQMVESEDGRHPLVVLADRIERLERDLYEIGAATAKMIDEKRDVDTQLTTFVEQVELMKIDKVGRAEFDDALAEKVDACAISRKVSQDQFNMTCDALTSDLEIALAKFAEQEERWRGAFAALHADVGAKPDRVELDAISRRADEQLAALEARVRGMRVTKRDREAAGAKSRLLRDVRCVSCDSDVVMRKTAEPYARYDLPAPRRTAAPHVAYDLDEMRRQRHFLSDKKLKELGDAIEISKVGETRLVNRYCGGKHTMTSPQTYSTRSGEFADRWRPEVEAVGINPYKGKDGIIYLGRFSDRRPLLPVIIQTPEKDSVSEVAPTAR